MKGLKVNNVNCFLLVLVLILVIVCCVKKPSEKFVNCWGKESCKLRQDTAAAARAVEWCISPEKPVGEDWVKFDNFISPSATVAESSDIASRLVNTDYNVWNKPNISDMSAQYKRQIECECAMKRSCLTGEEMKKKQNAIIQKNNTGDKGLYWWDYYNMGKQNGENEREDKCACPTITRTTTIGGVEQEHDEQLYWYQPPGKGYKNKDYTDIEVKIPKIDPNTKLAAYYGNLCVETTNNTTTTNNKCDCKGYRPQTKICPDKTKCGNMCWIGPSYRRVPIPIEECDENTPITTSPTPTTLLDHVPCGYKCSETVLSSRLHDIGEVCVDNQSWVPCKKSPHNQEHKTTTKKEIITPWPCPTRLSNPSKTTKSVN
jgi:hypothetical protein